MQLKNKKILAAKALNVGASRIVFNNARLNEINEAITRQDIIDLKNDGAIMIREISGRRKVERRTTRKKAGKVKVKKKQRKKKYMIIARKLRRYLNELRKQNRIENDKYHEARTKITTSAFKDKNQFKEYLGVEHA